MKICGSCGCSIWDAPSRCGQCGDSLDDDGMVGDGIRDGEATEPDFTVTEEDTYEPIHF